MAGVEKGEGKGWKATLSGSVNKREENVCGDILDWKQSLSLQKKQLLEKVEKLHFSQQGARLVHGFGQKFEYFNFHHFILGKIKKENVFRDILDRRKAFPDNWNIDLNKSKRLHFFSRG